MTAQPTLFHTPDRARWFLVPAGESGPPGSEAVRDLSGRETLVHPLWLAKHEIAEAQAVAIMRGELGETLGALRSGADEALAGFRARIDEMKRAQVAEGSPYTADSLPAMLALIKSLPGLVAGGLSDDGVRLEGTEAQAAAVEQRLRQAGIELDGKLGAFPGRLAALREDVRQAKDD